VTSYHDLPEWVWALVAAVVKEEDEHGLYYVLNLNSEYERVRCPGEAMLTLIPSEIVTAVRVAQSWPHPAEVPS
jgi:hypothetical protein